VGRIIAIWIFGLLAAGIVGGFAGYVYDQKFNPYGGAGLGLKFGVIGGWYAFACIRLWLAQKT
jgi:hypothetical protein